jgi:hypothetical protein
VGLKYELRKVWRDNGEAAVAPQLSNPPFMLIASQGLKDANRATPVWFREIAN